MKQKREKFYLVEKNALPEVFDKVMQVKEGIQKKKYPSVNKAVQALGISRSAYYKYRNAIFSYQGSDYDAIEIFLLTIEIDMISLLSILKYFEQNLANLISFQQSPACRGISNISVICRSLPPGIAKKMLDYLKKENGIVQISHQTIKG